MEDYGGDVEFMEKEIRHAFIKKVYGILTIQLAVTIGIISLIFFVEDINNYIRHNDWVFWTAFCLTFVLIIALACGTELRRRTPINIICLMLFTIFEGILLGVTCSYYSTETVLLAAGMCAIIVLGLTIFAFQTKIDFTMMSGLLFSLLMGLIVFGIFAPWYGNVLYTFYAVLGALIFCMFIVFDTQLLLGGRHRYTISPEEYIFAALNLYIDIVNLFLFLLAIFGNR